MEPELTVEQMVEATKETVRVNEIDSCYIRPLFYLGYGEMGLNPLPSPTKASIAVWPWGAYLGDEAAAKGVRAAVSSWQRIGPNVIPPEGKGTGQYINSSLAKVAGAQGRLRRGDPPDRRRHHRRRHGGEHLRRLRQAARHPADRRRRARRPHP